MALVEGTGREGEPLEGSSTLHHALNAVEIFARINLVLVPVEASDEMVGHGMAVTGLSESVVRTLYREMVQAID